MDIIKIFVKLNVFFRNISYFTFNNYVKFSFKKNRIISVIIKTNFIEILLFLYLINKFSFFLLKLSVPIIFLHL